MFLVVSDYLIKFTYYLNETNILTNIFMIKNAKFLNIILSLCFFKTYAFDHILATGTNTGR